LRKENTINASWDVHVTVFRVRNRSLKTSVADGPTLPNTTLSCLLQVMVQLSAIQLGGQYLCPWHWSR